MQQSTKQSKVIAVWGNPNSGKTTFSTKVAIELSKFRKNVILILCDPYVPTLSTVLPFTDFNNQSLGALLTSVQMTQEDILRSNLPVSRNDYLSIIGYQHGETSSSYAQYGKENVLELFIMLKHLADYIVVDCSSFIGMDLLSRTSLELADQVVRLISPDLKAISFFDATLHFLSERKYQAYSHLKVLFCGKDYHPSDAIVNKFGGIDKTLVYAEEVEKQLLEGQLFEPLKSKSGIAYETVVKEIIEQITGNEHPTISKREGKIKWKMLK